MIITVDGESQYRSYPDKSRLEARRLGAKAALERRKLDANPYGETDELHFMWLDGWAATRMGMIGSRKQNS